MFHKMLVRLYGALLFVTGLLGGLNVAQRRMVYKAAGAIGLAICVKFGMDAHDAQQWVTTAIAFVSTVLVPVLAHANAKDS